MANLVTESASAERRVDSRKAIMLAAALEVDGFDIPVKLRDLSETGALIVGNALPPQGAALTVHRLSLRVPARVAWSTGARCGVRFKSRIPIADWICGHKSGQDSMKARNQAHVDDIQKVFREDRIPKSMESVSFPPSAEPPKSVEPIDVRLAEEIAYVQRLLEMMSDDLIDEPVVLHRHGKTLQHFDLASQILGHIATIIQAQDRVSAVDRIGMEDLRARLKRKPLL